MSHPEPDPIVSAAEAAQSPYPFVRVNDDGTVRELHEAERRYLEEPFFPWDGGRPYFKFAFDSRDGWGSIAGFCRRSFIPAHLPIAPAPAKDPTARSRAEYIAWLKEKFSDWEVTETPNGVSLTRVRSPSGSGEPNPNGNPKRSWWRRLFGGAE